MKDNQDKIGCFQVKNEVKKLGISHALVCSNPDS